MKKNILKSVLALVCVLALAVGFLPAAASASDMDTIYVNGDKRVFYAAGELSAILRLPVDVPGRIHILTSGVNIALAVYNEETFELCGVYYTENGLIDVPFDAYPGTYLLGFSGWGEVAVMVADEGTTARLYADAQAEAAAEAPTEEPAAEAAETPVEEPAAEAAETPVEEPAAEVAEAPAEEPAAEAAEAAVEEPAAEVAEAAVEEPAAEPVETPVEEPAAEVAETPAEEPAEAPAEEPVEEPAEAPAEEPVEEPVYYDPSVPIRYAFTGGAPVSVLSVLNEVGAPVNMVIEVVKDTDGWFSSYGTSDGDWLFTPFAYFDRIDVSVRAGYFNPADGSVKDAVYTMILSYPDPAAAAPVETADVAEAPVEEPAEVPAEEPAEAPVEEPVEAPAEEPAEAPAEEPVEEPAEVPAEEPAEAPVEEPVEAPAEEPVEEPVEEPAEVPAEEPVPYDPSVPIRYAFTGGGTVSVLSILQEAGVRANMVTDLTRDTDGWFFATGSSDGDWLLTPFAYFDSLEVSVKAGYYDTSDGSVTGDSYTLILSYPDPDAKAEEEPAGDTEEIRVTIAAERREGNEIHLYAENLSEEDTEHYLFQWEYSLDSEEWFAVDGADSREYTFRLDDTNGRYYWRLIVTEKI